MILDKSEILLVQGTVSYSYDLYLSFRGSLGTFDPLCSSSHVSTKLPFINFLLTLHVLKPAYWFSFFQVLAHLLQELCFKIADAWSTLKRAEAIHHILYLINIFPFVYVYDNSIFADSSGILGVKIIKLIFPVWSLYESPDWNFILF